MSITSVITINYFVDKLKSSTKYNQSVTISPASIISCYLGNKQTNWHKWTIINNYNLNNLLHTKKRKSDSNALNKPTYLHYQIWTIFRLTRYLIYLILKQNKKMYNHGKTKKFNIPIHTLVLIFNLNIPYPKSNLSYKSKQNSPQITQCSLR